MKKRIKTAIWVDPAGCLGETPEQQIKRETKAYQEELGVNLDVHTPQHVNGIEEGTDLILFDFGGMMFGNDLAESNSRRLLEWAENHPSALVIITSTFTFDRAFRYAIQDYLGLEEPLHSSFSTPEGERHKTPIHNIVVEHWTESFIPQWFRDAHGCDADYRKVEEPVTELVAPDITLPASSPNAVSPYGMITLPNQKFFKPKKNFLTFMTKKFAKQHIFEVGAGMGHVAKALDATKKFKKVFALDLFNREGELDFPIYVTDAQQFPYPSDSVILFCRPCHGMFVEATIDQAIDRNAKAIVYVGLAKNVEDDLGVHYERFKKVLSKVGADGENIWLYVPAKSKQDSI